MTTARTPVEWEYRYKALREVYRQDHPRITDEAIDAFVDGKIAEGMQEAFGVGEESRADTSGGVPGHDPDQA